MLMNKTLQERILIMNFLEIITLRRKEAEKFSWNVKKFMQKDLKAVKSFNLNKF
jgi:hypothetical protein